MTTSKETPRTPAASPAEDRRAAALRILLALAEVDPTVSGATLILPDGSVTYLDADAASEGVRMTGPIPEPSKTRCQRGSARHRRKA